MTEPFAILEDAAGAINLMARPGPGMTALSAGFDQLALSSSGIAAANVSGALLAKVDTSAGVAARDLFLAYETAASAGGK